MPQFCRHNRLLQNCPICREPEPPPTPRRSRGGSARARSPGGSTVTVRRAPRAVEDGYNAALVPGLHARADARRLAEELAIASGRLAELATAPPGLYAEVAAEPDPEEAIWLAFLIAYLSPLDAGDPFAGIAVARTRWAGGEPPSLEGVPTGPRGGPRSAQTLTAYRRFAERAGSQAAALAGEPHWPAERRFARAFERLALPGLPRPARFDFLVTLGRTGRLDARPDSLFLAGTGAGDATALAGRRVLGIAEPGLLDRRAAALAEAAEVPVEAVELALWNWQAGEEGHTRLGASPEAVDEAARSRAAAAMGL